MEPKTQGWGVVGSDGAELWDSTPVFLQDKVTMKDWGKLIFYPKKFMLYRYVRKAAKEYWQQNTDLAAPFRVLDLGCGTGATLVDLKKMLGRRADVVGAEVVNLQVNLAREKTKKSGVNTEVVWYDGQNLPFADESFHVVYTSDVLGHVKEVRPWLKEINRVLKDGGYLTMFAESTLGRHAYIRRYLEKRGLNVDPHARFHISLYPKAVLVEFLEASGFRILNLYTTVWAKFFVHPDEIGPALQAQKRFFFLRQLNQLLCWLKQKTRPLSLAICELYSLLEMLVLGRWLESQGYVLLARKETRLKH